MLQSVQPLSQTLGQELSESVTVCCNEWLSGRHQPLFWLLHIAQHGTVQSLPLSSWHEVTPCSQLGAR